MRNNLLLAAAVAPVVANMVMFDFAKASKPIVPQNLRGSVEKENGHKASPPMPEITAEVVDEIAGIKLDGMTKDDLLALAASRNVKVAKSWTKAKIIAALA